MRKKVLFLGLALALGLSSCVSKKMYQSLDAENSDNISKLQTQVKENLGLRSEVETLKNELLANKKQLADNIADKKTIEDENERIRQQIKELNKDIEDCNLRYKQSLATKSEDLEKLSQDLLNARTSLNKRASELSDKEANFEALRAEFALKEKKLQELQDALDAKDNEVKAIHKKISDALLGFKDKGLNISLKDGRVYVSMDEKLLFKSASWEVGKEGVEALKEIAKVLELNPDINVMVEGHTDNIPLSGKQQVKDNWDLSVMRATSITKILLSNSSITPDRIIPSGRGEFSPLDSNESQEGRAKNRRTEIILTPKVSELLQLID